VCLDFFIFLFLTVEGEGGGGWFFFPSFEMWKEEGKGVIFSIKFFFHYGMAEEGKGFFFFLQIHYGGKGWLKVVISKILDTHGFEFISVFLIYSFRMSSTPST
jgi:hypothetical protein